MSAFVGETAPVTLPAKAGSVGQIAPVRHGLRHPLLAVSDEDTELGDTVLIIEMINPATARVVRWTAPDSQFA